MPKKAYLSSHFSSDELKQKYLKSQDSIESRRWHLLWKVSLGWTIKNSAVAIGINYDYAEVLNVEKSPIKSGIIDGVKS